MDREDLIAALMLLGCPKPYRFEDQRFIVDGAQPLTVIINPREITVSWRQYPGARTRSATFKGGTAADQAWEWIQQWI